MSQKKNIPNHSWILVVLFVQVHINSCLNCKIFVITFIRTLRIYKNRLKETESDRQIQSFVSFSILCFWDIFVCL